MAITLAALETARKKLAGMVSDYAAGKHAIELKRDQLAPKVMAHFIQWQQATNSTTFIDFARYLIPSIPADRAQYRNHTAYQALDYLRRIAAQSKRKEEKAKVADKWEQMTPSEQAEATASGLAPSEARTAPTQGQLIARLAATLLPFLDDPLLLWTALEHTGVSMKTVAKLRGAAEESAPILRTVSKKAPKLHVVEVISKAA